MKRRTATDRFIPTRSGLDRELEDLALLISPLAHLATHQDTPKHHVIPNLLVKDLLTRHQGLPIPYKNHTRKICPTRARRKSRSGVVSGAGDVPVKVLDAPGLGNNFFWQVMDWSQLNILAVGIEDVVFLYNPETGVTEELEISQRRGVKRDRMRVSLMERLLEEDEGLDDGDSEAGQGEAAPVTPKAMNKKHVLKGPDTKSTREGGSKGLEPRSFITRRIRRSDPHAVLENTDTPRNKSLPSFRREQTWLLPPRPEEMKNINTTHFSERKVSILNDCFYTPQRDTLARGNLMSYKFAKKPPGKPSVLKMRTDRVDFVAQQRLDFRASIDPIDMLSELKFEELIPKEQISRKDSVPDLVFNPFLAKTKEGVPDLKNEKRASEFKNIQPPKNRCSRFNIRKRLFDAEKGSDSGDNSINGPQIPVSYGNINNLNTEKSLSFGSNEILGSNSELSLELELEFGDGIGSENSFFSSVASSVSSQSSGCKTVFSDECGERLQIEVNPFLRGKNVTRQLFPTEEVNQSEKTVKSDKAGDLKKRDECLYPLTGVTDSRLNNDSLREGKTSKLKKAGTHKDVATRAKANRQINFAFHRQGSIHVPSLDLSIGSLNQNSFQHMSGGTSMLEGLELVTPTDDSFDNGGVQFRLSRSSRRDSNMIILNPNRRESVLALALTRVIGRDSQLVNTHKDVSFESTSASHIKGVRFNESGKILGVCDETSTVRLFEMGEKRLAFSKRFKSAIECLRFCGESVLALGHASGLVTIHDIKVGLERQLLSVQMHDSPVVTLNFSKNGAFLASSCRENRLRALDLGRLKHAFFSSRGSFLFNLDEASSIGRRDVIDLACAPSAIKALAWHPTRPQTLFIGGGMDDRRIRVFDAAARKQVSASRPLSQITDLLFASDGAALVSAHGEPDNCVRVWSVKGVGLVLKTKLLGFGSRPLAVSLGPKGKYLMTAAADQTLRMWLVFRGSGQGEDKGGRVKGDQRGMGQSVVRLR